MLWLLALLYLMGFAAAVLPVKSPANRVETADDRWTDEIGIVFSENHAKKSVLPSFASPSADFVPIKDADRVGISDPIYELRSRLGSNEKSPAFDRAFPVSPDAACFRIRPVDNH